MDLQARDDRYHQRMDESTALSTAREFSQPQIPAERIKDDLDSPDPLRISAALSRVYEQQWKSVGTDNRLSTNSDIILFLLKFYQEAGRKASTVKDEKLKCSTCQKPLSLICLACNPSSSAHLSASSHAGGQDSLGDEHDLPVTFQPNAQHKNLPQSSQADERKGGGFAGSDGGTGANGDRTGLTQGKVQGSKRSLGKKTPRGRPKKNVQAASESVEANDLTVIKVKGKKCAVNRKAGRPKGATNKYLTKDKTPDKRKTRGLKGKRKDEAEHGESDMETADYQCSTDEAVMSTDDNEEESTKEAAPLPKPVAAKDDDNQPCFACPVCSTQFPEERLCGEHIHVHLDSGEIKGALGKRTQPRSKRAYKRTKPLKEPTQGPVLFNDSDKVRPWGCPLCDGRYKTKSYCMIHVQSHFLDAQPAFKCSLCPSAFQTKIYLNRHVRKVHSGQKFPCETCGKTMSTKYSLQQHERIHSGEQPFTCTDCGKGFRLQSQLDYHDRRVHIRDSKYACHLCGKNYFNKSNLTAHMMVHTNSRQFLCQDCGMAFKTKNTMENHVKVVHKEIRSFPCHLCEHRSSSKKGLELHLRSSIHFNARDYICSMCGNGYNTERMLQQHILLHTGEKPWKCQYCPKVFRLNSELRIHVRIHTGERPAECDVCGLRFQTRGNMRKHRMNRHKDAPQLLSPPRGHFKKQPGLLKSLADKCEDVARALPPSQASSTKWDSDVARALPPSQASSTKWDSDMARALPPSQASSTKWDNDMARALPSSQASSTKWDSDNVTNTSKDPTYKATG